MAKEKEKLAWADFNTATLPKKTKALWDTMKETSRKAGDAREAFNDAFRADLEKAGKVPDGMYVAVGHNFGKLSVAFTDEPPKVRGAKKEQLSL